MSYQDLPDPRPAGVRLALRRMSRWAVIGVTCAFVCASLAGSAAAYLDRDRLVLWGVLALAALAGVFHYIVAIRWADRHMAWPHRRGHHRQRSRTG